ncbi:U6 snRNA phosphodiesterase Usb1 [Mycena floridula]|nr:U6 snRNA phosphodiesterase Usb1 [Mycena floridula]
MKRTVLVSYSSSDDEAPAPKRKKKLPALASSLVVPTPVDNPLLHQGRVRATPHVEGQWACHVYVCLMLAKTGLGKVVKDLVASAKDLVPQIMDFGSNELHISISRPIFLRAHQRDELKRAVKGLAAKSSPFTISFATLAEMTNDEGTRTFLAMEIGAGHHELKALAAALTPTLHSFKQKEYYAEPRFHASIAWALLERGPAPSEFQTIPSFPTNLIPELTPKYQKIMASKSIEAEELTLKIGKEVFEWRFRG